MELDLPAAFEPVDDFSHRVFVNLTLEKAGELLVREAPLDSIEP